MSRAHRGRVKLFAGLSAAALVMGAGAARAATDELVVTGTLIRGIAPVGAPVISLNTQAIAKTGLLDTASVLKTVPQISYLGISESTTGTTANGNGTNTTAGTGVNIRGMGQQATLTLINGHRGAPGGQFGNYFEPSNVPTIALSGIEILTDGASAIYGSDAMAGVVNLILRKDFNGLEARGSYGFADSYSQNEQSVIAGKTWDGGSVMVAGQRLYHSDLMASDRPALFFADGPSVFSGNGAVPRGYTNFSSNANLKVGSIFYAAAPGAKTFSQLTPNAQNILGAWYDTTALPQQERYAGVLTFDQRLAENVKFYAQGFISHRDWHMFGGVSGATTGVNSTLTVPAANPNFITGIPGVGATETVLVSQFANLGPLTFDGYEVSSQAVAGLQVGLPKDWRLDVNGQYAGNRVWRLRTNTVSTCGLTGGNPTFCVAPPGETAGAGTVGQSNPALAFNPFGPNNDYVLGRIRAQDLQQGIYDSYIATAKADGKLFSLPGGAVRAAVGYEFRRDTEGQLNTTQSTAPNNGQTIVVATQKTMNVNSLFGEVVIPLVGDMNAAPFARKLELSAAVRYSHYDILANASTDPKIGVTWEPADGLKITGSYSTSFRVNLASTDPNNAPLLRIRNITDYLPVGGTSNAIQMGGGNPNLAPETSRTWTVGADWRPSMIRGLDLNLTYFNIDYKGVIDTPGAAVLNSVTANSQAIYGAFLTRRPSTVTPGADDTAFNALVAQLETSPLFTGAVIAPVNLIIDARSQNAGVIQADGLDFSASMKWDTPMGAFDAAVLGEYFFSYNRSLTPTGVLVPRLDQIDFPQTYRLRGELGWQNKGLSVTLFGNYTPSYTNTYPTPVANVSAYTTFDLTVSYDTGDRLGTGPLRNVVFTASVENLFDKAPPYVAEFNQNFDSSITSMLQRVVTLQVSKKF